MSGERHRAWNERAKEWLNRRFQRSREGIYYSHQPIYGYGDEDSEPHQAAKLLRILNVLKILNRISFETLVDVGGGEGYLAHLVKRLFRARTLTCDLSLEANSVATSLFGIHSLAADVHSLPFPDRSFDVVVCSEVLEHLPFPFHAMMELSRITRRNLLLSTESWASCERERRERLNTLDFQNPLFPFAEMNIFTSEDLRLCLGRKIEIFEGVSLEGWDGNDPHGGEEVLKDLLRRRSRLVPPSSTRRCLGILAVKGFPLAPSPIRNEEELLNDLLSEKVPKNSPLPAPSPEDLLPALACPECLGGLRLDEGGLRCLACRRTYSIEKGVPILLPRTNSPFPPRTRHSLLRRLLPLFPLHPGGSGRILFYPWFRKRHSLSWGTRLKGLRLKKGWHCVPENLRMDYWVPVEQRSDFIVEKPARFSWIRVIAASPLQDGEQSLALLQGEKEIGRFPLRKGWNDCRFLLPSPRERGTAFTLAFALPINSFLTSYFGWSLDYPAGGLINSVQPY